MAYIQKCEQIIPVQHISKKWTHLCNQPPDQKLEHGHAPQEPLAPLQGLLFPKRRWTSSTSAGTYNTPTNTHGRVRLTEYTRFSRRVTSPFLILMVEHPQKHKRSVSVLGQYTLLFEGLLSGESKADEWLISALSCFALFSCWAGAERTGLSTPSMPEVCLFFT